MPLIRDEDKSRKQYHAMSIKTYKRKRDFAKTPEPRGRAHNPGGKPVFVIQQHDARAMHYDFRLEVDDVLKSWAVPKGPSIDPKVKRLAVPTEDHPIDYAQFEGVIPAKQYGAGAVIVWDRGTWKNVTRGPAETIKDAGRAIRDGHLVFELLGKKLKGRFVLQRVGRGRERRWFLIKGRDENASTRKEPVRKERTSVVSGKTVEQMAQHGGPHA
jgi:DNA ligase D-like protein (predicted 3'-phosphoesterase)